MKRLLLLLGALLVLLIGVVVVRTALYDAPEVRVDAASPIAVRAGAAERLAGAIRFPTISHADSAAFDSRAFEALHAYLAASFPRVHSELRRETVATHSLLYTWPGSNPSLKPILLMGHLDVVPIEPGTEAGWEQPPFSGQVADGFIWGRGAIDNKFTVLGTLEAIEMLLAEGFRPARTIHLAYGHDEEVGGTRGARSIAAVLQQRGIQLEMVLDEGGVIGNGLLPGVESPTALVGIAEKGFATVELSVESPGGHSSVPPSETSIGILAAAVAKLEDNPMPARLERPTRELFGRIGPRFPLAQRAAFANLWLTGPLVLRKLAATPTTNAMVRTTTAVTMFEAGTKENVLASHARAVVNFRVLQGDSSADVIDHVRDVVDDPRVRTRLAGAFLAEPSAVSSSASERFATLERSIRSVAPQVVVAPYLVVVVTDARFYQELTDNVFRFMPVTLGAPDVARMHGTNERVAVADYERAIRVYRQIIVDAAGR